MTEQLPGATAANRTVTDHPGAWFSVAFHDQVRAWHQIRLLARRHQVTLFALEQPAADATVPEGVRVVTSAASDARSSFQISIPAPPCSSNSRFCRRASR